MTTEYVAAMSMFGSPLISRHSSSILTCKQYVVGSGGALEVQYSLGGVPTILVPDSILQGSGICGSEGIVVQQAQGQLASSALTELRRPASAAVLLILFTLGLVFAL